jgi:hypothetical protein
MMAYSLTKSLLKYRLFSTDGLKDRRGGGAGRSGPSKTMRSSISFTAGISLPAAEAAKSPIKEPASPSALGPKGQKEVNLHEDEEELEGMHLFGECNSPTRIGSTILASPEEAENTTLRPAMLGTRYPSLRPTRRLTSPNKLPTYRSQVRPHFSQTPRQTSPIPITATMIPPTNKQTKQQINISIFIK